MGVLDISTRRVSLGNLGDVRAINTNTGALEAANRVADSVRRLNEVKIREAGAKYAGDIALGNGLAALGGGIAKFGSGAADFISKMIDEEDRRNEDAYANKFTAKIMAHNQGNGKGKLGAMNETIPESDKGEWMKGNADAADRFHKEVLKEMGLKDADFKDSRMQKWRDSFMVTQNAQWLGKRNAAMKAYADKAAEAKYLNDKEAVTANFVRDGAWKDAAESMERVIERRGWDPGGDLARAFRRKEGLSIFGIGVKRVIDETTAKATADGVDADTARSTFDTKIKEWEDGLKGESLIPAASYFTDTDGKQRNPLKEWTEGANMEDFCKSAISSLKSARDEAVTRVETRTLAEQRKEIGDESNLLADEMMKADADPSFVPTAKDRVDARIDARTKLTPVQRQKLKDDWNRFRSSQAQTAEDQRKRSGSYDQSTGTWVSPRSWAKATDPELVEKLNSVTVMNDPRGMMSILVAAKAAKAIKYEDYRRYSGIAKAKLDEKLAPVLRTVLGGKFDMILTKRLSGREVDSTMYGEGTFYKMDKRVFKDIPVDQRYPWAQRHSGLYRNTQENFVDDITLHKEGETDEYVVPFDAMVNIIDTVRALHADGVPLDKIDKVVEDLYAPHEARFFRLDIYERTASDEFYKHLLNTYGDRKSLDNDNYKVLMGFTPGAAKQN